MSFDCTCIGIDRSTREIGAVSGDKTICIACASRQQALRELFTGVAISLISASSFTLSFVRSFFFLSFIISSWGLGAIWLSG